MCNQRAPHRGHVVPGDDAAAVGELEDERAVLDPDQTVGAGDVAGDVVRTVDVSPPGERAVVAVREVLMCSTGQVDAAQPTFGIDRVCAPRCV